MAELKFPLGLYNPTTEVSRLRVTILGAAYEVTGSCYLVETEAARILVDCGMFQGSERLEKLNRIPSAIPVEKLDAVLLTHGHLDHCGRIPLLKRAGYFGPVYATQGTIEISNLILRDAAKIQHDDIERENKSRHRLGLKPVSALFTLKDVEQITEQFEAVEYEKWIDVAPGISARFWEAGHILGSTSIELEIAENGKTTRVVFSGDIGQWDTPIVRDPSIIPEADIAFVESTYGDRNHRSLPDTIREFSELITKAVNENGKILIPTFAVGRAQQILYHLAALFRSGALPAVPIYLDSPMAIAATMLYANHPELMDEEAFALRSKEHFIKDLTTLRLSETSEQSRALNDISGPCVILAGAGMCNAGRILHHLRHNLVDETTTVLIVGYQSKGSLGRRLLEGAETVKIHGETIHVRASVRGLGGFSAHAGQSELLRWMEAMARNGCRIVLTHGESFPIDELTRKVNAEFGIRAERPKLGDTITSE